jgi:hypothetical protein
VVLQGLVDRFSKPHRTVKPAPTGGTEPAA